MHFVFLSIAISSSLFSSQIFVILLAQIVVEKRWIISPLIPEINVF